MATSVASRPYRQENGAPLTVLRSGRALAGEIPPPSPLAACSAPGCRILRRRRTRRAAGLGLIGAWVLLGISAPRLALAPVALLAALGALAAVLYFPLLLVALVWCARAEREDSGPGGTADQETGTPALSAGGSRRAHLALQR